MVSTVIGARGLKCDRPVVAVADDKNSFADKVIEFLKNDNLCEEYIENCERFIANYNQKNLKELDRVINSEG